MHHHPDRLERPLMRIDGELRPTTWDTCLDDLGTRLRAIIDEHGPEAVGINFGTGVGMDAVGYRIAQSLHAALGTSAKFSPLTIDGTAKVLISDLMGGSSALNGRPDYDNATFTMFIGSNPVVSHGHTVGLPNPRGRDPRPRKARGGLGRRSPTYRDSAPGDPSPHAAAGYRTRCWPTWYVRCFVSVPIARCWHRTLMRWSARSSPSR